MKKPETMKEALALIAAAPKGEARKELVNAYRDLVGLTGAGGLLYTTMPAQGETIEARLSKTFIGILERLNARTGIPDGLGTLGGLGEYATPDQLAAQGNELLGSYDNVIFNPQTRQAEITTDIHIIARNNVAREAKEELQNLGITDYKICKDALEYIDMPHVTDDNFIVNRWDGQGLAFAVMPYGHLLKVDEALLDRLQAQSLQNNHEKNSEAKSYRKIPLFEALKHWGKKLPAGMPNRSEDGRDLTYDYRYPHEYILTWVIAAKVLDGDEKAVLRLANEVQSQTSHLIDLKNMADQMGIGLNEAGAIIGINGDTMKKMVINMGAIYTANRQKNMCHIK